MLLAALPLLIPSVVKLAEVLFPGEKRGEEKKSFIFQILEKLWEQWENSGHMPDAVKVMKPAVLEVADMLIEAAVKAMKHEQGR